MDKNAFPNSEDITRQVLDNGLVVLTRPNRSAPVIVLQGSLPAGSIHDPASLVGLSSFVSAMLTRGSQAYDFNAFNDTIESVGASLSANTDTHRTEFSITCLSEDFPTLLEVLADVLQNPTFPKEQIELVRARKLVSIQEREQDTSSMAFMHFYEQMYGRSHPYGRTISGYSETVSAITQADLETFHAERFTPNGAILAIAGDIEPARAVELVQQHFSQWTGPVPQPSLSEIQALTEIRRFDYLMNDKIQSDIVIGHLAVNRKHPDYFALRVADTILGKFGMMGRLGEKVREEQGLAYYSYSSLDTEPDTGLWYSSAGVNPGNVQLAIDSILNEYARLGSELVPDGELSDSQAYMTGTLPIGLETNGGVASILHSIEVNELGLDYLLNYHNIIYGITPVDVQRVAHQYLKPDKYVLVVAGPATSSQS